MAGTRHRRRAAATLSDGFSVMLSIRALISRELIFGSRAQDGINPFSGAEFSGGYVTVEVATFSGTQRRQSPPPSSDSHRPRQRAFSGFLRGRPGG